MRGPVLASRARAKGVARQPCLLGRRGEPGRSQGRPGGEQRGAGQGSGAGGVREGGDSDRFEPGGQRCVRPGSGAGPLDEGGERECGGSRGAGLREARHVPGPRIVHRAPVAGLRQQGGEQFVGGSATGPGGVVEHSTGGETVGEVNAAACPLEQATGPGAVEQGPVQEGPGQSDPGARAQQEQRVGPSALRLVLLGRRGEQEQAAGPVREVVEAFGVGGQHRFAAGQGPGQRGASGELVRGEAAGEPAQQAGVSTRLAEDFGAHDRVEPFRAGGQPVQQRRGRPFVQGREMQRGQSGEGGAVRG